MTRGVQMRGWMGRVVVGGCVLVTSVRVAAQNAPDDFEAAAQEAAEEPAELGALRRKYHTARGQLQQIRSERFQRLAEEYRAQLIKREQVFREQADLDNLLVTREELARIGDKPELELTPPERPEALAGLWMLYQSNRDRINQEYFSRFVTLTQGYLRALRDLQSQLTRDDRIEDAIRVRDEVEAVSNAWDYAAALENIRATTPPSETP